MLLFGCCFPAKELGTKQRRREVITILYHVPATNKAGPLWSYHRSETAGGNETEWNLNFSIFWVFFLFVFKIYIFKMAALA